MPMTPSSFLISILMFIVGGVVAAVTIMGLISHQVNSAGDKVNSSQPTIDYGKVDQ